MKTTRLLNGILFLALAFIALDKVLAVLATASLSTVWAAVTGEFVTESLCYIIALLINFRVLLPRMLYRGRLAVYAASLMGFALLFTAVEFSWEYFIIHYYHIQPGIMWYFSNESILFFELLSTMAAYIISFAGSGVIIFVEQWRRSGKRVGELEKLNAQGELVREKSKIDMQTMFGVLDGVMAIVQIKSAEAVERLMELSKSLREQLYHSNYRKQASPETPTDKLSAFSISPSMFYLFTARRYHPLRLLLLFLLLLMIGGANFNGSLQSLFLVTSASISMLGFICINIYVLVPRYLLRNRPVVYAVGLVVLVTIAIGLQISLSTDALKAIPVVSLPFCMLSNMVKFVFLFCGTTVFVLFQNWLRNEQRINQLATAALRSELEQLQNQVNPHFLFNMLNNIIVLTKENPDEAAATLHKLTGMLRYQFDEFGKQHIRLGDDIRFLTDYLNLEKLRRDRFEFSIVVDKELEHIILPPMLFIPFVENAVKHNNDNRNLSYVWLQFERGKTNGLTFTCINSKPLRMQRKDETGGLGLTNIRRRLELIYGDTYHLQFIDNDKEFKVQLVLNKIEPL